MSQSVCVCIKLPYRMADIASTSTTQATTASPAAAASAATAQNLSDEQELNEFREIVWGSNIRLDVFQRWSQGLFSIIQSVDSPAISLMFTFVRV